MDLSTLKLLAQTNSTFRVLRNAYKSVQTDRLIEFFRFVDLRLETMSDDLREEFNNNLESATGQQLLADYANTITKTSSPRARMVIALLYCNDSEFRLDDSEKATLVSAIRDLSDDIIDFFLIVTTDLDGIKEGYPYPRMGITDQNFASIKRKAWDEETVFVYIDQLIRLRLLLHDPASVTAVAGKAEGWAVWFGCTSRSIKFASFIRKAKLLCEKYN